MVAMSAARLRLDDILAGIRPMAIAVSGGVDSMTLAHVAQTRGGDGITMVHARSPAVPDEATARVEAHAVDGNWRLEIINAREMQDPRYLENPVNRCFFCKTNLYSRISANFEGTIVSGANVDDLGDFRPGLQAARNHRVRHPYVEAGISKADIRRIAHDLGLDDIADLPAAPCLSSRIETGIAVTTARLSVIGAVETALRERLGDGDIRCRLRKTGIVIELEARLLDHIGANERTLVAGVLKRHGHDGRVTWERYRKGSAFVGSGH